MSNISTSLSTLGSLQCYKVKNLEFLGPKSQILNQASIDIQRRIIFLLITKLFREWIIAQKISDFGSIHFFHIHGIEEDNLGSILAYVLDSRADILKIRAIDFFTVEKLSSEKS